MRCVVVCRGVEQRGEDVGGQAGCEQKGSGDGADSGRGRWGGNEGRERLVGRQAASVLSGCKLCGRRRCGVLVGGASS